MRFPVRPAYSCFSASRTTSCPTFSALRSTAISTSCCRHSATSSRTSSIVDPKFEASLAVRTPLHRPHLQVRNTSHFIGCFSKNWAERGRCNCVSTRQASKFERGRKKSFCRVCRLVDDSSSESRDMVFPGSTVRFPAICR